MSGQNCDTQGMGSLRLALWLSRGMGRRLLKVLRLVEGSSFGPQGLLQVMEQKKGVPDKHNMMAQQT